MIDPPTPLASAMPYLDGSAVPIPAKSLAADGSGEWTGVGRERGVGAAPLRFFKLEGPALSLQPEHCPVVA